MGSQPGTWPILTCSHLASRGVARASRALGAAKGMPLKMSTESPKRLSFLLTPPRSHLRCTRSPAGQGGRVQGALAGGPRRRRFRRPGFPEVPPRQLQGRAHLHLGLRPLPPAHITGGAGSIPIPPHPYPQGVLLPESQRGAGSSHVSALREAFQEGWDRVEVWLLIGFP